MTSGREFGDVKVSPDQRKFRLDLPNDTYWSDLWAMDVNADYGIDLIAAHDLFTTKAPGEDAVVAVLDTGYTVHPDLADSYIGGYDFINDPSNSNDGDGRDADPSARQATRRHVCGLRARRRGDDGRRPATHCVCESHARVGARQSFAREAPAPERQFAERAASSIADEEPCVR